MAKRMFDIVLSTLGLLLLAPMFLIIAVLIKLDSVGPVFYRGLRVGRHGRPFRILKFRTMVHDAERRGGSSTPEDDARVTGVGKILRRYKLDELPQAVNVLRGEMSLVGPRPQVPWAVQLYSKEETALFELRPGITDYASLFFVDEGEILRGSEHPDRDYMEKIHPLKMRLSLEYLQKKSLWLDCKILFWTLSTLLWGKKPAEVLEKAKGHEIVQNSN